MRRRLPIARLIHAEHLPLFVVASLARSADYTKRLLGSDEADERDGSRQHA
jgi:hypothetical protein